MRIGLGAVILLAGCHGKLEDQSAVALEGFTFGWQHFNHRVSHVQVQLGDKSAQVAVIGGTSTTNQLLPDLPAGCEQASCNEFPVADTADVTVSWAKLSSTSTALVAGTVHLEVGADGSTAPVSVTLPKHAPKTGTALISGLRLSTDHPLAGDPACYNPAYGWHPRDLALTLGKVAIDGDQISVPVTAAFAAGKTFDPARQCIDDVNDRAVVSVDVDVLFLAGDGDVVDQDVVQGATYPFSGDKLNPEAQADPSPLALDFGVDPTVVGFAAMDFQFDPDNTEGRGSYLRTLGWEIVPKHAPDAVTECNATATNYSPGTQLTDFGYRFEGVARAVTFDVDAERGTSAASLPAALDASGAPVVSDLPY